MPPFLKIHSTVTTISTLIVLLISVVSCNCKNPQKFLPYPHSFSAVEPSRKATYYKLFKNLIGDDGRVYACSGKDFFAFESNGTIAWTVHINYTCNPNIAPVNGGSTSIYVVAENRVLKIYPLRIMTSEASVELFFGPALGKKGPEEIIGISASISSSCVLVNVKNRALFAFRLHGQLIWTAGPILYQHGYRQGCLKNVTECYFTSPPVIDHCEASIFISNNVGELYSLSVRGPYYKWIKDLSSYGDTFKITPGNNGRLYVTIPEKGVILALDVSTGSILWQGVTGPLSLADYEPVVDANGWISYGSLDGFLYSFSPNGDLIKFPKLESLNSVIQVNPVLDCSGYAVYISQTEMEGKFTQATAEYTHVSALKPKKVIFTLLVPASGSIYVSVKDPSRFLFRLSQSDLRHFVVDENTLLAFFAASRNGNPLPCRSTRQKLASSCSQVKPESISIYTGNQRAIILFIVIESIVLVILAGIVWYCCIFWKKKKLQGLNLGKFLEKRRSLRSQKKAFDRMITELEQKASDENLANEVLEKLSNLVREREGVRRKLSTTYSLGRDGLKSQSRSLLPLHDKKTKSFSFRGPKKESVTIFHTRSDSSSSGTSEYNSSMQDEEFIEDVKGKGKADVEVESSSEEFVNGKLVLEHSVSEIEEVRKMSDDDESVSRRLRRRTVSFGN